VTDTSNIEVLRRQMDNTENMEVRAALYAAIQSLTAGAGAGGGGVPVYQIRLKECVGGWFEVSANNCRDYAHPESRYEYRILYTAPASPATGDADLTRHNPIMLTPRMKEIQRQQIAEASATPQPEAASGEWVMVPRELVNRLVAVLGPEPPDCLHGCQGCEWEWNEALNVAKELAAAPQPQQAPAQVMRIETDSPHIAVSRLVDGIMRGRASTTITAQDLFSALSTYFIGHPALATPPAHGDGEGMDDAYAKGWRECAKWADREDLIADIGSPAYERDKAAALGGTHHGQ
jgi:hypothetical protein